MIWQRACLAIGLAAAGAFASHAVAAQKDDPGAEKVDHSEPAPTNTAGPKVIVSVNLTTQRMHVQFPDGSEETWLISSGRPGYDTPGGKYKPQWIDPDHVSKQYQDAPMPYAVFFDLKGHAFHGSDQKKFGVAQSHGCVRLPTEDAKKLFEAVKVSGAEIEISGKAQRKGVSARRQAPKQENAPTSQAAYGYGYDQSGYPYARSAYPPYPGRPAYQAPQPLFGGPWGGGLR